MATRSGSLDPGLVLWLQEHENLSTHEVAVALETRSGLFALAGTGDMRLVEAAAGSGDPDAILALEVYLHRLVGSIASMAASLGGLNVLAFTGGVGEGSPTVRRRAAEGLAFLGAGVDRRRNEDEGDRDISSGDATVTTVVIEAREDLEIAREVRRIHPGQPAHRGQKARSGRESAESTRGPARAGRT